MIELLLCMIIGFSDDQTMTAQCGAGAQVLTLRLAGVDVPTRDQPYGLEAGQILKQLLYKQSVRLECRDQAETLSMQPHAMDRDVRVCSVWVTPESAPKGPKTLDVGMALLTTGLACYQEQGANYLTEQEQGQYSFAQEEARAKGAGLWHRDKNFDKKR